MATPDARVAVNRIHAIDFVRGIVMIVMALDHVRDYFHFNSFLNNPTDLKNTTAALFATRWITHICAPTFILLAGTSAYLMGRKKTTKEISFFLFTRGLWLILAQLTIIRFGWNFDPLFHFNSHSIISAIGVSMIALSVMIYLPIQAVLAIGLVFVVGHNALDGIRFEDGSAADVLWSFLHVAKSYDLGNGYAFGIVYPFIPWTGVIALGYCLGRLFDNDYSSKRRKRILVGLGIQCVIFFFILRLSNIYGDPTPWSKQGNITGTIISFFNIEKYPPSLLYLAATLGIALILLGKMEDWKLWRAGWVSLFGRTAFFYYVLHIYTIHIFALIAVLITGHSWHSMVYYGTITAATEELKGSYGFNLAVVYLIWMSIVAFLYPFCVWWNRFKTSNKSKWWVSYV
jgi:uncharacterized membrane protein